MSNIKIQMNRKLYGQISEFNTSVGKLAPLLKRIKATDWLIDAIVYKLYGLTEDEIKIVEGSISGEKQSVEPKL